MRFPFSISAIYLLFGLTGQILPLAAQRDDTVFAPIGATWYYSPSSYGPPWMSDPLRAFFLVEKDTFMLGYEARVMGVYVNEENQMVRVDSLTKYVATIGNQVYYKVEDEFVLLYDFGAQAGDTIHSKAEEFGFDLGCNSDFSGGVIDFAYVVDSVGILTIDGEDLRAMYINSIWQYPGPNWIIWGPVVERFGALDFAGFWWGHGEGCIFESGYLRCYVDDAINWRSSSFNDHLPCDYISSSAEIYAESFTLHPNPAQSRVYFPLGAEKVVVFDLTGRKLTAEFQDSEIDVATFSAGMYFISFELNGVRGISSFIKTE